MRHRFSRADRIRATKEFREVIRGGEKVSGRGVSVFAYRRGRPGQRLGLAVASRLGGAVARNRIKRRLREYVRLNRAKMADGLDLVVVVHRDLSGGDAETFREIVADLFRRAGLLRDLPPHYAEESARPSRPR
ncbi:MAG: ribonuclease P protein component, ribonuclease P protein component [candidate division NC10 bacterium CSP1-5]|nr:MAG: ribonuclease P protein component, ribonuclease P protein component [candidate division NC10 bacterium CSP1-5]